jgi:aromatic-L-amino-acid decarboxylase
MARKKIYIIAATFRDKHILRFVVCSRMTESRDITFAWEEIRGQADQALLGNTGNDTPLSIRKTYSRIKTRKECPSNELKANGITSGQA